MTIINVINLVTLDNEFKTLVEYVEYKLREQYNKKLEAQWWEECEKMIATYVENKMQEFDQVVTSEVE
jgi:hypothetical protein